MNYIKVENGIITDLACGSDIHYYLSEGFEATDREVITGYDGKLYFKDECPKVPRAVEIEKELEEADETFYISSQQPIEFEGHIYKFEWTSLYQSLLGLDSNVFPTKIWDLTELEENAVAMSKDKLQELQNQLVYIQETAFQLRKATRAKLLKEKSELMEA